MVEYVVGVGGSMMVVCLVWCAMSVCGVALSRQAGCKQAWAWVRCPRSCLTI